MHYYQFNIGDYQSHTGHLDPLEDIAYRRLLDWYYLHETPIPLEINEVARQIRMRSHNDCIASVLQEYFECTDDGWIHHRANAEIGRAGDKSQKASQSAKARWDKLKQADDANALRTQSKGNATQDTEHKTQDTKKSANKLACPPEVDQQVWDDWYALRKAKNAPITQTVVATALVQAGKANITLNDYLKIWCARGSQGMKAEWITEGEKSAVTGPSKFAGDI